MCDYMSEAEYLDDGGDYLDCEHEEESLYFQRRRREEELIGKYLIVCKGYKSKKQLYLQDRSISTSCWWTYFLSNAIGFDNLESAKKYCSKYKHNSTKVVILSKDKKLINC